MTQSHTHKEDEALQVVSEDSWEHKPKQEVGEWTHSGDSGYCSRPFWVVHRYNPANMFSTEYLNTRTGRKRFYDEAKAIAAVGLLNASTTKAGGAS